MGLLTDRRKAHAVCNYCKSPGYILLPWGHSEAAPDGRPTFKCTGCGDSWTCGYSGGVYMKYAEKEHTGYEKYNGHPKAPPIQPLTPAEQATYDRTTALLKASIARQQRPHKQLTRR